MSIKAGPIEQHWSYFLTIEQDMQRLARFVEFHKSNFKCFSVEIAHLLMAAAAECDVVCKQICQAIDPQTQAANILQYKPIIVNRYTGIPEFTVHVHRYGLKFKPWSYWAKTGDHPPLWWTANNKIKHHRHTHFDQGHLKHALNAVAGLYVMVLYLYRDQAMNGQLMPVPQLFRPSDSAFHGVTVGGIDNGIAYQLP